MLQLMIFSDNTVNNDLLIDLLLTGTGGSLCWDKSGPQC